MCAMSGLTPAMARELAEAAARLQETRTGHAPSAVTVVLSADTLVITLHGALTPAEQQLTRDAAGAAKVQEFHRSLFATSSRDMKDEVRRITGVEVREAAAEVEPGTGAVVFAFTSGTMVQVYVLEKPLHTAVGNSSNGVTG